MICVAFKIEMMPGTIGTRTPSLPRDIIAEFKKIGIVEK